MAAETNSFNGKQNIGPLGNRLCVLAAGRSVDAEAVRRRGLDLAHLRRLGEAYRMGWLHNVMGRITPLTTRSTDEYLTMADLFIESGSEANHLLDRYDADLEEFCIGAGIMVTERMTYETVSPEIQAHVFLYRDINVLFADKFGIATRDPISTLANANFDEAELNPYLKEFMDSRFSSED